MNIIEFFFGIFKECFNVINIDFFGLGFTWLEFLLAIAIIFVVFGFLKSIVGVGDSVAFENIVRTSKISNKDREKQVSSYKTTESVMVWNDGTYLVSKEKSYRGDN